MLYIACSGGMTLLHGLRQAGLLDEVFLTRRRLRMSARLDRRAVVVLRSLRTSSVLMMLS